MRVDRPTLARGVQLVLLLPSVGFAAMAVMGGTAGILGGVAGAAGLFDTAVDLDLQVRTVYVTYILVCLELMLVPALGYGLLIVLIVKGAKWMAARRWLAVLTLVIGANACVVASWLALDVGGQQNRSYGLVALVYAATLIIPVAVGTFNMVLLLAALVRRRQVL